MQTYRRIQAVESKTTRFVQPREQIQIHQQVYREPFLRLALSWQTATEEKLARQILGIFDWAASQPNGLLVDELDAVGLMVHHLINHTWKE